MSIHLPASRSRNGSIRRGRFLRPAIDGGAAAADADAAAGVGADDAHRTATADRATVAVTAEHAVRALAAVEHAVTRTAAARSTLAAITTRGKGVNERVEFVPQTTGHDPNRRNAPCYG